MRDIGISDTDIISGLYIYMGISVFMIPILVCGIKYLPIFIIGVS